MRFIPAACRTAPMAGNPGGLGLKTAEANFFLSEEGRVGEKGRFWGGAGYLKKKKRMSEVRGGLITNQTKEFIEAITGNDAKQMIDIRTRTANAAIVMRRGDAMSKRVLVWRGDD